MNDGFLKYFIIHLKNIIFFKFTIYIIMIIVSIWLLQISNNEFTKSSCVNDKAKNSIAEAKIKLHSIEGADEDIINSIDKYKKILNTTLEEDYDKRNDLKDNLLDTVNKYSLNEPAEITITQFFFSNKVARVSGDNISVGNYDVALNFCTQSFAQALDIIKDCYSIMPENTLIISLELEDQKVLNRNMVSKLSTIKRPNLIATKLIMRIREINYDR
jgi:hypothetical protein